MAVVLLAAWPNGATQPRGEAAAVALPTVIRLSTAAALQDALARLTSGQTLSLAPGTYDVPGQAFSVPDGVRNVTIAGATGRRDEVVIRGGRFGFWANDVGGLTIRDLTIAGASVHGVILNCAAHAPALRNLVLRDIGDQFVKSNPGPNGCGVDDGLVEDCLFEYTQGAPDAYTNGVDVHFGRGWTIRRNTFRGFVSRAGLAGPAILVWNGSRDTTIEDNVFVDNARDISLGLDATTTRNPPVGNSALTDHLGGRIAGNTITRHRGLSRADVGILVADSPGTVVEGNTVTMAGTYANAIEYRFPRTTGVAIRNNTVDAAITGRDGASATLTGNSVR